MSNEWQVRAALAIAVVSLATVGLAGQLTPKPGGNVAAAIAAAKARGRDTTVIKFGGERSGLDTTWSDALSRYSVVLAAAKAPDAATTVDDYINSWHTFAVSRWLLRAPLSGYPSCTTRPPDGAIPGSDELTVLLVGGSMTIDGVAVTVQTIHSSIKFERGTQYLMLVSACPNRVAHLAFGPYGIFSVEEGKLVPMEQSRHGERPYWDDLTALGTVDRVISSISRR